MKLTHYAMIFLIIFLPLFILVMINNSRIIAENEYKEQVEKALTASVQSAVNSLIIEDGSNEKTIYRDYLVENVMRGFFAALGIMDDSASQERIRMKLPVICITYDNGFIIRHMTETYSEENGKTIEYRYSELKPYFWREENKLYCIAGNEKVKVYDLDNNTLKLVDIYEVQEAARSAIVRCISEEMTEYCKKFGNGVVFNESVISEFGFLQYDNSEFERALHTIGIIAFFYDENIKGTFAAAGCTRQEGIP